MNMIFGAVPRAAALAFVLAGCFAGPAQSQGDGSDVVAKGKAACRALRASGLMEAERSAPDATTYHELGPGWRSKNPSGNPRIRGVYGVGGTVMGAADGSEIQWWSGVFPSIADAKADMEDHRLWPQKLERSAVDSNYDEGYTSTDTSAGKLAAESGGEALMPAFPYVEGRFRCGRLVVCLLWQRVPKSPVPAGDSRVA